MTTIIGYDKPSLDDSLVHHGVKGMHWGVRRGKAVTGISRTRAGAVQRNEKDIKNYTKLKNTSFKKNAVKLSAASLNPALGVAAAAYIKSSHGQKAFNTKITTLHEQNDRLKSGNLKTQDFLKIYATANITNLVVRTAKS